MYKIFKIIIITGLFLSFVSTPLIADAQNYKGGYSGEEKKKKKDRAVKPVPKIFSSKLESSAQAERLDVIYENLLVSLWNYSITDFIYQKKLYSHIKPEKFQTTRYAKEFTTDMNASMDNLNKNYKNMMSDIDKAQEKYTEIKEDIKISDHEILEPLWEEKIDEIRAHAETHFKMQGKFLNLYKNLVKFILKQAGSYYYKAADQRVYFYKFGGYKFYGQSIDKLRMISFKQRKHLRSMPPANIDAKP